MQTQVIALGKQLVDELALEPGVDTLSRWMCHYLAEKLTIAEQSKGEEKEKADEICFETILNLWAHRSNYMQHKDPLKRFEPIYEVLERLNPQNHCPYYEPIKVIQGGVNSEQHHGEALDWANIALSIDKTARELIDHSLSQGVKNASDEEIKNWLQNAKDLPLFTSELKVIIRYMSTENEETDEKDEIKQELSNLNKRIERLTTFIKSSEKLISSYQNEKNELLARLQEQEQEQEQASPSDG